MTESLNPRVEFEIKEAIDRISQGEWTISETAKKLIRVGIAIREADMEPKITGPLGIPRPFASISLSDKMTEIRTEIDEDLATRLTNHFDNKRNTAAREAIRLGVIAAAGDHLEIEGPAGGPRPFADINIQDLQDTEIRELSIDLRKRFDS